MDGDPGTKGRWPVAKCEPIVVAPPARVAESVYAADLKSAARKGYVGSSPTPGMIPFYGISQKTCLSRNPALSTSQPPISTTIRVIMKARSPGTGLTELVVGVFPPAVDRVVGDRYIEIERHPARRHAVDGGAEAAQLDEGGDQQQGKAVEERRPVGDVHVQMGGVILGGHDLAVLPDAEQLCREKHDGIRQQDSPWWLRAGSRRRWGRVSGCWSEVRVGSSWRIIPSCMIQIEWFATYAKLATMSSARRTYV